MLRILDDAMKDVEDILERSVSPSPPESIRLTEKKKRILDRKNPVSAPHHPTYLTMIKGAVLALNESKGASKPAILKYLAQHYPLGENLPKINSHLKTALKKGTKGGDIEQVKGSGASGTFKMASSAKIAKESKESGRIRKRKASSAKPPVEKKKKKAAPKSASKSTPKSASKSTPKSAPKSSAKTEESTPKTSESKSAPKTAAKPKSALKRTAAKKAVKKIKATAEASATENAASTTAKAPATKKAALTKKKTAKKSVGRPRVQKKRGPTKSKAPRAKKASTK